MRTVQNIQCHLANFSELKRQLKAQKKAEEKGQKGGAASEQASSAGNAAANVEIDDQELDPNVCELFVVKEQDDHCLLLLFDHRNITRCECNMCKR